MQMLETVKQKLSPIHLMKKTLLHLATLADSTLDWEEAKAG